MKMHTIPAEGKLSSGLMSRLLPVPRTRLLLAALGLSLMSTTTPASDATHQNAYPYLEVEKYLPPLDVEDISQQLIPQEEAARILATMHAELIMGGKLDPAPFIMIRAALAQKGYAVIADAEIIKDDTAIIEYICLHRILKTREVYRLHFGWDPKRFFTLPSVLPKDKKNNSSKDTQGPYTVEE